MRPPPRELPPGVKRLALEVRDELTTRPRPRLPPGETSFSLRRSHRFQRHPLRELLAYRERFGPIFTVRIVHRPVVAMLGPEANHFVTVSGAENFSWREGMFGEQLIPLLGDGLITTDWEYHDRARALMMPAFHRAGMEAAVAVMVDETERALAQLPRDEPVDVYAWVRDLAISIAMRALFGLDPHGGRGHEAAEWFERALAFHDTEALLMLLRGPGSPWSRLQRARRKLDRIVYAEIARRRADDRRGEDLFSMLLEARDDDGEGFSDRELRDQLMTMLFGGHDTSSSTFSFLVYELARNPAALEGILAEQEQVIGAATPTADLLLGDLPQLDMALDETLRLYPPVWFGPRKAVADFEFAGHLVPAGTNVIHSSWASHRLPEVFPEPNVFTPERFAPDARRELPKGAYIPFGGGRRICIGKRFGQLVVKTVATTVLQRVRLDLAPGFELEVERLPTLSPGGGLSMVASERRAPQSRREPAGARRLTGDPRAPVLVGAGQVSDRPGARDEPRSPLALMEAAARLAAEDAGGDTLLRGAGSIAVVHAFSWPVPDPGSLLAEALGADPHETVRTPISGTSPIELLGDLCNRIQAGELDAALIAGAEAVNEFGAAMAEGRDTGWPTQPEGAAPTRVVGEDRPPSHESELAASLIAPISYYPLFENAVRGAAGRGPGDHRRRLGELWARFAAVGEHNPNAWARSFPGAEEIATPGPQNRLVAEPYTKLMTANIQVTQGAALLLCSDASADAAGVAPERRVYVHATAEASDHWFAAERERLDRSPAIAACGEAALGHAGAAIDDVELLDLYSCFPSAVEIAATELGIDLLADERSPTLTGGLTFAGGPGSNYATHSLAAMVARVREHPDSLGLASAVGWYLTKHALAVLGGRPPARPFVAHRVQDRVDRLPGRNPVADSAGASAPIEAYTVIHGRDPSPTIAIVSCLLEDDRRAFAKTDDPAATAEMLAADPLGREVRLGESAEFELA